MVDTAFVPRFRESALLKPDVGFVCRNDTEYANALRNVARISPQACREKAMREFHYQRMAADYVNEYEKEIAARPTAATLLA